MTSIIFFITRMVMLLAVPTSIVLLILKETGVLAISWVVIFIPIIIGCVLFTFSMIIIWQRLDSENFD